MTTRHRSVLAALGLLLLGPAADAAITPEARAVISRYLEVTGGADPFLAEHSVHSKGTLDAFGLRGTVEAWAMRPDKSASLTAIGPFTLRDGCDGAIAWRVDQNGKLARRDGKDLEDARAAAYFENEMWLTPDQGGGSVTLRGTESDTAGTYSVLEVTPPVGRRRQIWFATATGLIARMVQQEDQHTVVTRTSEFHLLAGRRRPGLTRQSVIGMPANDAAIALDSVWVNQEMEPALFAPPERAVSDVRYLGSGPPARLPFRYGERHVWLRASLNAWPAEDFLLDTGASLTVIDSAYAARHGLKSQGRLQVAGAGAAGGASLSEVDSIVVGGSSGGVVLSRQKVVLLSLNPYLEPFFWRPVAGVLGYDFISRFVIEVDYDQSLLTIHDPKSFRYAGEGTAVPMTMAGNIPAVPASVDGIEGQFRLDVGSGSTVDLHGPFVERHDLLGKLGKTLEVTGGGFGGTFTARLGRMRKFEIGSYAVERPLVSLSQVKGGGLGSQDYAGTIGNQVLERFRCTFDYERRVVYLEPGPRFPEPDRFSLAGVQLARIEGTVRTLRVLPGSAAEAAGLHENDEVILIDRRPIAYYTVDQVTKLFENGVPGEKHVLEIRRDGERRKITIKLKQML
ncbi:MAG TPA: aspartyl protease family protein [Candidatus Eisenbacteria bacterium]|jgi:hypothetical protein